MLSTFTDVLRTFLVHTDLYTISVDYPVIHNFTQGIIESRKLQEKARSW